MVSISDFFHRHLFRADFIPFRFALTFAAVGVTGVLLLDRLVVWLFDNPASIDIGPLAMGIAFTLFSALLLYLLLRHMRNLVYATRASYIAVQEQEKENLRLFNFALDHSADAIYWFTFDTRFFYVNDAACAMLGYTKEQLLSMSLEDIDRAFPTEQGQSFLQQIKARKQMCFERTQTRRDGSTFPAEISANYFRGRDQEFICAFGRDISERRRCENAIEKANAELTRSVREKETLIREVHHRVKNNLEIISSLLSMQYRRVGDGAMRQMLLQSRSRIHTMALVHELLYRGGSLAEVDLSDYIGRLLRDIVALNAASPSDIDLRIGVTPVACSTDACVRIGMIVHELCVNALKYAFAGRTGNRLEVALSDEGGQLRLRVADNGPGVADIAALRHGASLGMQLITTIAEEQLDGEVRFENRGGLQCEILFPKSATV